MSYRYFLVNGTMQELRFIAREQQINPKSIKLIANLFNIQGYRGGEIIFGYTGRTPDLKSILDYAHAHNIKVP